jgi:hypothetical protein
LPSGKKGYQLNSDDLKPGTLDAPDAVHVNEELINIMSKQVRSAPFQGLSGHFGSSYCVAGTEVINCSTLSLSFP